MAKKHYSRKLVLAAKQKVKERSYWSKKLAGDESIRGFFPETSPGAAGGYSHFYQEEQTSFTFTGPLFSRVQALSRGSDYTLHIILTAGLMALVHKYSGRKQQEIMAASPIYKQEKQGEFINTVLVIKNTLSSAMTFKELLMQVKQTVVEATENQVYPLEVLMDQLNIPVPEAAVVVENIHDKNYIRHLQPAATFSFLRTGSAINGALEYNVSVFKKNAAQRLVNHLTRWLETAVFQVDCCLGDIDILSAAEKQQLLEAFNDIRVDYPREKTIHQLFEEQVELRPDSAAVVGAQGTVPVPMDHVSITYNELNRKANRLANYLCLKNRVCPDEPVGILMDRGPDLVAAIMGILKSGAAYVPLEPSLPEEWHKHMIDDARIGVVISQGRYIRQLNRLQWDCQSLHTFLCLDSPDVYALEEREKSGLMDIKLWEYVGETVVDEITGGGWYSSYTGAPFPAEDMAEYSDNILKKLSPFLHPKMRVLEIGCASGISMYRIAPRVGLYYGTDLSTAIIEKNKSRVKEKGLQNIILSRLPADEIDTIEQGNFDLVILNSVIQHFHGHNYLRKVLRKAVELMAEAGILFIGDVMDRELKQNLILDLTRFKQQHRDKKYRTKTDWSNELFVSRSFFRDLTREIPGLQEVECSNKIGTIRNELTEFRYDALIKVDKSKKRQRIDFSEKEKLKHQHDRRQLETFAARKAVEVGTPHHLAYIIYTSGTTGVPKGVMVEHCNVVQLLKNRENLFDFNSRDIWTMFHSYAFDFSVWEINGALVHGGRLVVIPEMTAMDTGAFLEVLRREKVTVLNQTPSAFYNLSQQEMEHVDKELKLRYVIFGGEALQPLKLKEWNERYPHTRLINMYGITETTVHVTYKELTAGDIASGTGNIGKPIPTLATYVVGEGLELLPRGAAGELCVGGEGAARGYCSRPELTTEKFINKSFCGGSRGAVFSKRAPLAAGGRIYKSGDRVRLLENGDMEYIGRIDHQVKIRGFRIEPGEIETYLLRREEIEKAIVIAREEEGDEPDDRYLCAYIVAKAPGACDVWAVKSALAAELPAYMVPQHVVLLDHMPLTPNGKVDRNALPTPEIREKSIGQYLVNRENINALLAEEKEQELTLPAGVKGKRFDSVELEKMVAYFAGLAREYLFNKQNTPVRAVEVSEVQVEALSEADSSQPLLLPLPVMESPGETLAVVQQEPFAAVTYDQLEKTAQQLAGRLKAQGVKAGSTVGMLSGPSAVMVEAVAAAAEAGVNCLTLDPGLSSLEIASQLDSAGVPLLLSDTSTVGSHRFTTLQSLEAAAVKPYVTVPRPQITQLDRLPFPNRSMVNQGKFNRYIGQAMAKHYIALQATRGCPYKCAYCHKIWPKTHVFRSAENIFREVQIYYDMGVKRFVFIDDIFNLNVKNSTQFFQLLIKNNMAVQLFFPNGLRGDVMTKDYIDLMVEAGSIVINLALETASPRLQKLIGKNLNLERFRENCHHLTQTHPHVIMELGTMHGFPSETEEEALMTLNFIKSLHWVDFPYVHLLKIYPNTDMEQLALAHGVSGEAITRSMNLAYHEVPETLPFDKSFTIKYQTDFFNNYFLSRDRLLSVLPQQMRVLTPDELLQKYNSYLPEEIHSFEALLRFLGVTKEELGIEPLEEDIMRVPDLDEKLEAYFGPQKFEKGALNVLLLDLSQSFSSETNQLNDLVERPLGLVYVMTYLKQTFGSKVHGKIAKSRIDFDSYEEFRQLLEDFKPDVIGIRTLTFFRDFFHKGISLIRQWGFAGPITAGGPYATSDYPTVLQDPNISLVGLGEGEETFAQLVEEIIANGGKLPQEEELKTIPGIAFIPSEQKEQVREGKSFRQVMLLDTLYDLRQQPRSRPVAARPGKAVSFVFHQALQPVMETLKQGGTIYIGPKHMRMEGIHGLHFSGDIAGISPGSADVIPLRVRIFTAAAAGDSQQPGSGPGYGRGSSYTPAPPQNEIEKKLLEIWSEVLGIEESKVGMDMDFFELGGHSLKATKLIAKIHKHLEVKVPLVEMFTTPTIKGLAGYIKKRAAAEQYASLEPLEKRQYYPLSSAQQRLFVLHRMEPHTTRYNMPMVLRLEGTLDKEKLEKSINRLIQRHESLRTSFYLFEEKPVQRVHDEVEFEIEYYDQELSTANCQLPTDFIRPFDLSKAPLLRAALVKETAEKYILLVDMHHIITDGTSMSVLVKEFMIIYGGEKPTPLRLQYKDYAGWQDQRNREKGEGLAKQAAYWKSQFAGEIPVLHLPVDLPRPLVQSFEGGRMVFDMVGETVEQLKKYAAARGVTLFMLLLSIYSLLLMRLSRQEDVVVGTAVEGRRHVDLHSIIGMFVNTLALRNFPAKEKSFAEFLREVKKNTLQAFENQDYPLEELVEQVVKHRDPGRNPLLDVMFAFQNFELPQVHIPGLKLVPAEHGIYITKFDLTLQAVEIADRFTFTFEYCTRLWVEKTIRRFAGYFKQLVASVLCNPNAALAEIEILPEKEKKQILEDFNGTARDYPDDKTIPELFEKQVKKSGDGVAVVCVGAAPRGRPGMAIQHLTYEELNEKSDQLAHRLRQIGVQPDSIVGIMMERSLEMFVGILGILKAGGAYLAIEPEYPRERIDYMLKDSNAGVLVSEVSKVSEVSGDCEVIELSKIINENEGSLTQLTHPTQLCYIIYTSGTTGRPKGVLIEQRGIANLVQFHAEEFKAEDVMRVSQVSSLSFDALAFEVWPCLLRGGALYLVPDNIRLDPRKMKEWIIYRRVTASFQSTATAEQLLEEDWPESGVTLRILWTAGDRLTRYPERPYPFRLFNLYGPTEDSVWTTWQEVPVNPGAETFPPLGKPVANHYIYILESNLKLQPVGIAGELCISGTGTARGYLNNPELTAEKFLSISYKSYRTYSSKKIYKTGDLARWLADGRIEFLGRIDSQVQVRGFRVELAEIENLLKQRDEISDAVVICRDDTLCSYVVLTTASPGAAIENQDYIPGWRDYLSQYLPAYMVPSYFVQLQTLPFTASGKVDKQALPLPEAMAGGPGYAAPAGELEEKLAGLWSEVLGINKETIGIDSDFFLSGGQSLKATRLASKIEKTFHVGIPVTEIFITPTIRGLANYIAKRPVGAYFTLEPTEEREYYALSPAQKRQYILQQLNPQSTVYNLPVIVTLKGKVDIKKLEKVFQQSVLRHESLQTSFEMIHGEPVQRIRGTAELEIQFHDFNSEDEIIDGFIRAFDLEQAPLLRVGIIERGTAEYLLMLDMHHIIWDGVSTGIFFKEFMGFYNCQEPDQLRLQYKDFSQWQNRQLRVEQERYWLERFADGPPLLRLPEDFVRPAVRNFDGNVFIFQVGVEETSGLKRLADQYQCTLYMVLLSMYFIFLSRVSGREDIVVGSPVAGRRHADLEDIIGMFVNTLAVRSYPQGKKTFPEFLREIKEITLQAFENQDFQFEELVEKLSLNRDAGRNPLFDVVFTLQDLGVSLKEIQVQGLELKPYEFKNRAAKFDLTLVVTEDSAGEELYCSFEYAAALFEEETISRLAGYLKRTVCYLVKHPKAALKDVEILTDIEKHRLLEEFDNTCAGYPRDKTIHELFAEQAAKTPGGAAVVGSKEKNGETVQLTYGELNEKSNQLAKVLRGKGVQEDDIIGIKMERSVEMIIGILGILKAGGAYLPIDAEYPQERIDYMLKDSSVKILVSELSEVSGGTEVVRTSELNTELPTHLTHLTHPTQLCYIIYTSGTTGRPKGTMIDHRNVVRLLMNDKFQFDFGPGDVWSQFHSICFDFSVWEMWGAFVYGGRLIIIPKMTARDPHRFLELLKREQVSVLNQTPGSFYHLIEEVLADNDSKERLNLRWVIFGGEALAPGRLKEWQENYPQTKLVNMYGITETTVHVTFKEITQREIRLNQGNIGKPIPTLTTCIIDKYGNLQPPGVAGELCVGGEGVARGYLNRPELTAEKFLSLSYKSYRSYRTYFSKKIYKSGDLARWLSDGDIEYLGRIDHQVKVRGFRVELGEIEYHLKNHPEIREVVVIKRNDGEKQSLCAYFVQRGVELSPVDLKNYLAEKLPGYMIPAYFIRIDNVPLTSNGKFDHKMLPQPREVDYYPGSAYAAPETNLECLIAETWKEVLQLEKVGIHDNFFDLGGTSLDIIKVNKRLRESFAREIPVAEMFMYSTVHSLARYLGRDENQGANIRPDEKMDESIRMMQEGFQLLSAFDGQTNENE